MYIKGTINVTVFKGHNTQLTHWIISVLTSIIDWILGSHLNCTLEVKRQLILKILDHYKQPRSRIVSTCMKLAPNIDHFF